MKGQALPHQVIDLTSFSCKKNIVGKLITSFNEDNIEAYIKNEVIVPAKNTDKVLFLPVLNKDLFISISAEIDTNGILIYTEDRQGSILPEKFPTPKKIVDLNFLWQQNLEGKVIDPEQVFYWCENNRTTIMQRLEWRTNSKGPLVISNKYIKLFEISKYLSVVQVTLHDLLNLQQLPEALLCQFDESVPAAGPVQ